jgi:hypothetical protein
MKRLAGLSLFIVLVLMIQGIAFGGSGSRLIKEMVGPDQTVEYAQSRPVIISKKEYRLAIAPKSILVAPKTYIKFTLVVYNPKDEPLSISTDNIRVYAGEKNFELLSLDKLEEEYRKEILKDYNNLSKEQVKALTPFIEDKMQRLRNECLKDQKIPPQKRLDGLFGVDIPMKTPKVTIEIITQRETHSFSFNIIDL